MPRLKEINPELIEAITHLYWWQYSGERMSPSFYDILYFMFQKADVTNVQRLRRGFPSHYMAWKLWSESVSQEQFFSTWLGEDYGGVKDERISE